MGYRKLIDTLAGLVRINSVNPAYPHGRPEADVQAYILDFFRCHEIAAREQQVLPGRANVIGILPGRSAGRRIIFEAHTDTAGVEGMTADPFEAEVRDGRLYGRGACDNKAGLAAMLHAIADLKRSGTAPGAEVWVAATVDEEHAYRGVLKLRENLEAAAAVVAEPSEMRMVVTSKGCLRWRTTVRGRAAHSSKPHLGVNAIFRMARVLVAIEEEAGNLGRISHPLVGSPTWTVGVIKGGTQVNIVPDCCSIEIDRRLIPGEDPESVLSDYETLLNRVRAVCPDLDVSVEPPFVQDWPLETPCGDPLVSLGAEILCAHGLDDRPAGVAFGSDASKFGQVGVPSIIFGPGSIDQAHTAEEYVETEHVEKAFVVYRDLMERFE
jgi:acetylornithine deacetylase/succinyl-diaminopimelate desuccinylase family protein